MQHLQLGQNTLGTAVGNASTHIIPLSISDLTMVNNNGISGCTISLCPPNLLAKSQPSIGSEDLSPPLAVVPYNYAFSLPSSSLLCVQSLLFLADTARYLVDTTANSQ